jgi:phenylpropionate dioxygenase-like ring-hydroxylating dioxygenase large terminal subunit
MDLRRTRQRNPNPGDYFLCEIADDSVIVLRGTSGEVHAFYNVCRHRGSCIST